MKKTAMVSLLVMLLMLILSVHTYAYVMYAPDGRTIDVSYNDADAWRKVGWYDAPVTLMCTDDGRTAVVYKSDVQKWISVGWHDGYEEVIIYAPDGRVSYIYAYQLQAYKNAGWYDYPVYRKISYYQGTKVPTFESVTGFYGKCNKSYNPYSGSYSYTYSEFFKYTDYPYIYGGEYTFNQVLDAYTNCLKAKGFYYDESLVNDYWNSYPGWGGGGRPVGLYRKGNSAVELWLNLSYSDLMIYPQ